MAVEPWVAVKVSLPEHRKIDDLMEALKLDRDQAIGKIVRIWRWIRINALWGVMEARNLDEKIARACDWREEPAKLLEALVKVGWFDKRPDGTYFAHNWDDHNYALIRGEAKRMKQREQTRDRQRRYKARERLAMQNRYKAGEAAAMSYPTVADNALANAQVTRYPEGKEKKMDQKPGKKPIVFGDDASVTREITRDLTGEVTRDRLLNYEIKHPHTRVIQFFLDKYKATRQEDYIGPRDRMARNIKDLRRDYEEEEIARRIVNYFASTDPYYTTTVKFDWATFYSQFNRLGEPVHPTHQNGATPPRRNESGFDKPKGTEVTIDDFE